VWRGRAQTAAAAAVLSPADIRDSRDNEALRLLLVFALQSDSCCIDVGAHEGIWLEQFRRLAPRGRHVAYEPLPHMYEGLAEKYPEMDVRNAALSNAAGEASFVHVTDHAGYSGLRERTYPRLVETETITVRTERLDDSLADGYVPTVIIIDVEGAEQQVVEGALETIRRHQPIIVFEHGLGAADHYGTTPRDMHRLLVEEAGLSLFDLDGNGPFDLAEFEWRYDSAVQWNWVARA
jgi:FkbM family methyltransferase